MLSCDNLTISVKDTPLISALSFSLFDNSLLLIKGKNGCGKSTLLKALAGFTKIDSGKILWQNRNIYEDISLFQSSQIAYLGHQNALKPYLTVRENLQFYARAKNTEDIILAALAQFKIDHLIEEPIYKLSEGTQKKIALSRIILSNSKLWLLDEPENNLDNFGKEMLAKLINIRTQEGGTVIITSHADHFIDKTAIINLEDFSRWL